MNAITKQTLIISLIKDDLLNTHLVNGLNKLGLQADSYYLQLSETIFELMGFEDNEESDKIYTLYLALMRKTKNIHLPNSHEQFILLALEIYNELVKMRLKQG